MADHDPSYRLLFSHPRMVEDLLRGFVGEPWVDQLDFSRLENVTGRYVTDRLRRREADVVWRLPWDGERGLFVYLLLEFQSTVDPFMAVRVMAYLALLYQDLIRRRELTPTGKLPPVLPVVLYNGKEAWRAAREVADLIEEVPEGLGAYRPRLRYLLLDEGRLAPAQVAEQSNLAALLFRLERGRRLEEVQEGVEALGELLGREQDRELRRSFGAWLTEVLLPARLPEGKGPGAGNFTEVRTMLRETVAEWTRQWREEGWQEGRREGHKEGHKEGRKEGRREGEAALLLRLLERRFGVLAPEIRRRVESADDEHLLQWGERVLTAATVEEVFRARA